VPAEYNCLMATINEVEELALDLPENDSAVLAAHLFGPLPPVLHDAEEGIAEALRRRRAQSESVRLLITAAT
jgi:hypothetical protein